ncbi:hypothetical protein M427DRAFT_50242 [Gonapodya prolifera JEL478]|uniref:Uncharacterized protein n=1 Tax=Gonapodya prolifera (strain JEL478) TaxID=1344416 RepID=A0A138ZWK0_GONPJ|nr:hypothetical protein M427DRAFT_50242 [Gonapodya prolifera JEL478]|eukprot:KXS08876.1 hypothetical protein M427DRAFT_50242 [Gonapodya prolifera JEL478]
MSLHLDSHTLDRLQMIGCETAILLEDEQIRYHISDYILGVNDLFDVQRYPTLYSEKIGIWNEIFLGKPERIGAMFGHRNLAYKERSLPAFVVHMHQEGYICESSNFTFSTLMENLINGFKSDCHYVWTDTYVKIAEDVNLLLHLVADEGLDFLSEENYEKFFQLYDKTQRWYKDEDESFEYHISVNIQSKYNPSRPIDRLLEQRVDNEVKLTGMDLKDSEDLEELRLCKLKMSEIAVGDIITSDETRMIFKPCFIEYMKIYALYRDSSWRYPDVDFYIEHGQDVLTTFCIILNQYHSIVKKKTLKDMVDYYHYDAKVFRMLDRQYLNNKRSFESLEQELQYQLDIAGEYLFHPIYGSSNIITLGFIARNMLNHQYRDLTLKTHQQNPKIDYSHPRNQSRSSVARGKFRQLIESLEELNTIIPTKSYSDESILERYKQTINNEGNLFHTKWVKISGEGTEDYDVLMAAYDKLFETALMYTVFCLVRHLLMQGYTYDNGVFHISLDGIQEHDRNSLNFEDIIIKEHMFTLYVTWLKRSHREEKVVFETHSRESPLFEMKVNAKIGDIGDDLQGGDFEMQIFTTGGSQMPLLL